MGRPSAIHRRVSRHFFPLHYFNASGDQTEEGNERSARTFRDNYAFI